mgnify:FL=1
MKHESVSLITNVIPQMQYQDLSFANLSNKFVSNMFPFVALTKEYNIILFAHTTLEEV